MSAFQPDPAYDILVSMRRRIAILSCILAILSLTATARAEDRTLLFVFGPATEEHGRLVAHAAANTARPWLESGASIEIQIHGVNSTQTLTKAMPAERLEKEFLEAARDGRANDLNSFINDLDRATFALRRHPGKRVLVVILETPPKPDDLDGRLTSAAEFCKGNSIPIVVLDPADSARKSSPDLKALSTATQGVLLRDVKELDNTALLSTPVAEKSEAAKDSSTPAGLVVHTRLVRTLPLRAKGADTDIGPMNGLLLAEAPMDGLQFDINDQAGNYSARARVTLLVKNADSKVVWQGKKDITVKGSLRKFKARKAGNLCYLREVKLPPGHYTLEATVEDLLANKSATASEPLTAIDSLPGFAVSDALFVRPLDDSIDRFEADQVLSFDGKALSPLLAPVFHANTPTDLQLYLIIYPDIHGAIPDINFEILKGDQVVGRSHLPFNDQIRNTTTEGGSYDAKGEQKHEFPYTATILGATFGAGDYQARVSIRQDRRTITRTVPFRVL